MNQPKLCKFGLELIDFFDMAFDLQIASKYLKTISSKH